MQVLFEKVLRANRVSFLEKAATEIIKAKRERNQDVLLEWALRMDTVDNLREHGQGSLFIRLIHFYHPDRLESNRRAMEKAFEAGDRQSLERFALMLGVPGYERAPERREPDYGPLDFEQESPLYEAEDFDQVYEYGEQAEFFRNRPDDEFYDFQEEEQEGEGDFASNGFVSALEEEILGNMASGELFICPGDLAVLNDVNLGGRELDDLEGIQFCANLKNLDLSENNISSIQLLGGLLNLNRLDLSFNDIEDIAPLRDLRDLNFLDLTENPVRDFRPLLDLPGLQHVFVGANTGFPEDVRRGLEERGCSFDLTPGSY